MKFLTVAVLICFTIVNSSNNNNYNINRDSNSISNSRLFPSIGSPIDNKKDSVSVTNNNNNKPKGLLSNDAKETIVVSLIQGLISYGFLYLSMKLVFRAISTFGDAINDIIHKDSKNNNNNNSSNSVNKYLKPNCTLSIHESEILSTVIDPKNIELTMDDIGGLDTLKSSLMDLTLLTKEMSDIASVVTPVRSVLLYGPPGCGKTALARALSKSADIPMICVVPSLLLRKFVGETSQMTSAVFSLASKLQPCLIFIDEMDSLFRCRFTEDHSVDRNLKTEFMQLWDTLIRTDEKVIIFGATNMPGDIDPAIKRRFEREFHVPFPDSSDRVEILKKMLHKTNLEDNFDFNACSEITEGYSPSDLRALSKAATFHSIQDYISSRRKNNQSVSSKDIKNAMQPLKLSDFQAAVHTIKPSVANANPSPMGSHGYRNMRDYSNNSYMFYPDTNGSPSTDTNSADNDMPWNGNASDAPVFPDDDSEFDSDYDAD